MKITFFSNFMNHHQLPIAEAFLKQGVDFTFVATTPIEEERIKFGYEDMNKKYPFVLREYESTEAANKAMNLCRDSDVIILGSAPEKYIKERLKSNKITFRYSERYLKQGLWRMLDPRLFINMYKNNFIYRNKPFYLLASSAYAPWDFSVYGAFKNKCYKWGYFPKNFTYNIDDLLNQKKNNKRLTIMCCGRLLNWKHPEKAVYVAEQLKKDNIEFDLNYVGTGPLKEKLEKLVLDKKLENNVHILGATPASEVRKYMDESDIFLFTSDYNEGWGAVLNESMNSACAVVASHAIGSVPYLIKDGYNGLIYKNNSFKDLYKKVKKVALDISLRKELSINAYNTINETWNADKAVSNLLVLIDSLSKNKDVNFHDEPCEVAKSIRQDRMYGLITNDK